MSQHEVLLRTHLSNYKNPAQTKTDIINTLNQYKDLHPTLEPYVFNDGHSRELVQLEGTIPINYKGNTYNIPISIWVLDTHPHNPPIAYVKPTTTMQIKPGRYVDANGKVDMPCIREWRHPTSDLLSLVQILTLTFGEDCPVFSRSPGQRPASHNISYPGQTPYPANPGVGMPMPGMPPYSSAGTDGVGPGYPTQPGYPPYSTPSSYPSINPPYPGYPPTTQSNSYPQQYQGANPPYPGVQQPPPYPMAAGRYPQSQSGSRPPYPMAAGGYPQSQSGSRPPYPMAAGGYPQSQSGSRPPYPATYNTGTTNERPQFTPGGTVTEADIRASLLSAVEDKMKRRLKETFQQAQAETDVLTRTQKDLNEGKQKLETIITDLHSEKVDIERNIHLLKEKNTEVEDALQKMENNQEVNVDEAVVTTTPLYRQLVDAFAEEQAIEDAIYYLGEGLRKNVIELESFLKRVRELSRKQFILRATLQKCREKAGLPPLL